MLFKDFKNAFSKKYIILIDKERFILAQGICGDFDIKFDNCEIIDIQGNEYYELDVVIA